ncbi:MAG: hypothetical protein FJ279_10425 [Planctomycetes bacterium]|nr:hypothetical protein [Planctomycetota bacterium]MBM4079020.1 hypothetical protein [Planctomycetota bacterium]MBM4084801.1 hypothetical protein [Planctomycetota bacterium]
MDPSLIIAMFVVGLALISAEIFIPGVIVGLIGAACVGLSIYWAYTSSQTTLAYSLLAVGAAYVPVFILLWFRVFGKFFTVSASAQGFTSAPASLAGLANAEGVALTTLRPSGMASFDGRRVDVVTRGEMVEKNTRVRVVKVEGNRVVVQVLKL